MSIIKARQVAYDYLVYSEDEKAEPERFTAVDGVTLDIQPGEFVAILGHNGSGKSTLAKHLNALLLPTRGTIWIDGTDTKEEKELWKIRQKAGMVFQNPDNQIIGSVVEEDVGFGPENVGMPTEDIWMRVEEALTKVGMIARRTSSPNRLSGGQKQRVAIAGVVAMRPQCIILDEPTAMLDPNGRAEVLKVVHELNEKENVTVVLITHYMEEVVGADRIYVMDQGKVIMTGPPREIFAQVERLKSLRLDVPQATELAYELRKEGIDMPEVLTRSELVKNICDLADEKHIARKPLENVASDDEKADDAASKEDRCQEQVASDLAETSLENKEDLEHSTADSCKVENASAQDEETTKNVTSSNRENLLKLENVSYTYGAGTAYEVKALENINLEIGSGEFIGIIGHTGSGKSTLVQLLNGLEKPSGGRITWKGQDIFDKDFPLRELRTKVGLVFQYPEHQLFESDILTDVSFGPKNKGLSKEKAEERAWQALQQVGVSESLYKASPFDISGGQKRRVAIAGVLAMDPEVLILDEPTAGLDPVGRDDILDCIKSLQKERGITVILVTHSMEDAASYADRLIVVNDGHIRYDDTPRTVFSHYKDLETMGLAAPEITYIMHELKTEGLPIESNAMTVKEAAQTLKKLLDGTKKEK